MRLLTRLSLVALACAPLLASAANPSAACRDGAASCRDAWDKLEKCELANAGNKDACTAERAETDAACKQSSKACHTDGSRSAAK